MEFINQLIAKLDVFMSGSVMVTVAMLVEFALRMIKSDKPMGIVHMISGLLKSVGMLFGKVAELLDKVLPQKLK
jgi:uncharacterized membrane protein (UPF0136 family)